MQEDLSTPTDNSPDDLTTARVAAITETLWPLEAPGLRTLVNIYLI